MHQDGCIGIYTQLQLRLEDVKFEGSLGYLDLASENLNQTQIIRNFIMFFFNTFVDFHWCVSKDY